jgi:uncharacterized Tic20 family protein
MSSESSLPPPDPAGSGGGGGPSDGTARHDTPRHDTPRHDTPSYGPPGYGPPAPPGGYVPPPPGYGYGHPLPMNPGDERTWATLAHIGGLVVPFAWLIIYLIYKDRSAFVRRHAIEATNFHLSVLIYEVAAFVIGGVIAIATFGIGLFVLVPLVIAGAVAALVFSIMGAMAANRGEEYRYPLSIRMLS